MSHNHDAARRFLAGRPGTKFERSDERTGVRYLWSLLYRAVRRQSVRLDHALRSVSALARRLGNISTELTTLSERVTNLERAEFERRRREVRRP